MTPTEIKLSCASTFGWHFFEPHPVNNSMCEVCGLQCSEHKAATPYDTDANASLQLIDKLAEEGWSCDADNMIKGQWCVTFRGYQGSRYVETHIHNAETFPLAVAGAYLKVLNLWTEEVA